MKRWDKYPTHHQQTFITHTHAHSYISHSHTHTHMNLYTTHTLLILQTTTAYVPFFFFFRQPFQPLTHTPFLHLCHLFLNIYTNSTHTHINQHILFSSNTHILHACTYLLYKYRHILQHSNTPKDISHVPLSLYPPIKSLD